MQSLLRLSFDIYQINFLLLESCDIDLCQYPDLSVQFKNPCWAYFGSAGDVMRCYCIPPLSALIKIL